MNIEVRWWKPIELRRDPEGRTIYVLDRPVRDLPRTPGIYYFGRPQGSGGKRLAPIYIGQTGRLRSRIRTQLNNLKLMLGLQRAPRRKRYLVIGELVSKGGQDQSKALRVLERGLIEYALTSGHELLNVDGTRTRSHDVQWSGNRKARQWLPKEFAVRKAR